ncbi:hypothetical protein LguiA_024502 [Lonicera macranthoides]
MDVDASGSSNNSTLPTTIEDKINKVSSGSNGGEAQIGARDHFTIEHILRLVLYMIGKEQPIEQELKKKIDTCPKDFPLLQGWSNKLHPFSNNNHEGKDVNPIVNILKYLQPHDMSVLSYSSSFVNFKCFSFS